MTAPEPLKLVWAERQLEYDLTSQRFKIGRGAQNEIQIPDQLVSSNHALLQNGVLSDKGSTNGTFVNGEVLGKSDKRQLKPGDVIMFGDTRFTVERGPAHSAIPKTNSGDDSPSSSDEEDNNNPIRPSVPRTDKPMVLTNTQKKADESSPIGWHPKAANGITVAPADARSKPRPTRVFSTGLAKAGNAEARKLEEELDKLKHQLYYGDREEKSATAQLLVAKQELETLKKHVADKNKEIFALHDRVSKGDQKEKTYDQQLQYLMKELSKMEARLSEQQSIVGKPEHAEPRDDEAAKADREQALAIYKKILANQQGMLKYVESSANKMNRALLILSISVVILVIAFVVVNGPQLSQFFSLLESRRL